MEVAGYPESLDHISHFHNVCNSASSSERFCNVSTIPVVLHYCFHIHKFLPFQVRNANGTATIRIQPEVILFITSRSPDEVMLTNMLGTDDGMDNLILMAQVACDLLDACSMKLYRIYT